MVDDEDNDDDEVVLGSIHPSEHHLQQLQEEEKENHPRSPSEIEISSANSDITLSPAQQSSSDCIIIDTDLDQITDVTPGQYDDAPEVEEEEKKDYKNVGEFSGISDTEGSDSNALYCICRQKQDKRFMICCDSCQDWFHGDCVGISETQGRTMEKKGQEYICPPCTTKKQSQLKPEPHHQPEPELSFPECLTLSPLSEEQEGHEELQDLKESVLVVEEKQVPVTKPEPEPEAEMETDSSFPLCIGPECFKQALPDSVYCGTDCILQHAAVTMKTLSGPKVPKSRGRPQRKAAVARPTAKGQRSGRMSKRLAGKGEEEVKEDDGGQEEAATPLACDPSLSEVQATSIPSSKLYTAFIKDCKQADNEVVTPSKQPPEDTPTDVAPSSQPATEPAPPQSYSQQKAKEPVNSVVSKQQSAESDPSIPPNQAEIGLSPAAPSPSTSAPRHHETGALMVTKTTYVIPKKQPGPQPPSGHVSASASGQKSSSAPTLLNETRNLLVPPAPSAPSSRPSQPNNQVRQSIQRSLSTILFKRVCDCEDLEMSESEVAKVVASIEMEMFDIFRNTDSKYMNKYRTIMFNLKDPRNKGLLCRVVRGEISPFRLARMSQKDMQATKASEPSAKETEVKDAAAKAISLLQKPEAVKVDLPSLNPARPDRNMVASQEQKSFPAPALKTRISQGRAVPDILACMLKDTTSEHKAHLFDLKCKICTGQILAGEEDEPAKKKTKVSEIRDKHEPSWRKSAGDDSPLQAPPDSPDMDSPTSSLMDPSSRLIIDAPELTIIESPASPIMDSPASPTLESPASPVMESPASPTPDTPKTTTQKRAYTPVVIPAVSTVTITRRDPRTAASRFSALSSVTSGPSNTTHNPSVPYAPLKESISASHSASVSSRPPTKPLPKSILMKPSSSVDPRLYGTSSRTVISESPADGETSQFLAKQDIVWKGFLNMLTVAKFVTKGYLVSGSAENLKADLPDTIQIGGRILPQTVWDYVAKLKSSVTKELCVIRFHPATEEEEVAYVSLFSYFSSRGRFGVVANGSRSIKDVYLVPLSAKESIPSILQPLNGPGLERNRPNLLLGLAVIQKAKRPGSLPQEIEEKRPKVHMSKDPMWIPKPPVLYGSDKLEIFQPYDPETPASTTPPGSPPCPGSPSDSSSSGSVTIPSPFTSFRTNPPVPTSATQATSNSISDKNPTTASSDKTPLQTILNSLFGNKQTDSVVSSDGSSTTTTTTTTTVSVKKVPMFSQTRSMVDPIVEQYGQKSKVKKIEEEENDFDRPYDPEEEYDPAMAYGMVAPQSIEKIKADGPAVSGFVDDGVAYDPEDETIFEDIQSDIVVTKPPVPTQTSSSPSCPAPVSIQIVTPAPTSTPALTSTPAGVRQNIPTGTVVVSAATLTEQQRMLEELNKQIEEQKRQLKEQEEALRQQREAVGMFMAHFSVSDSLMSPPQKSLPVSQLSESTDKTSNLTETVDSSNVESQTVKLEDTTAIPNLENDADNVTEQDETQENVKESSAGEIEDSDVAYDPEDESLFNEIQDDVFQGGSIKTRDSSLSRTGHSASRKGTPLNAYHSRKRRLSPKKRSRRERDHHRSPSRRSQRRSPSHSRRRRERDRHRRSERDRSRHRARDQSERQGHHSKEHSTHRHSHGRRRSPSSTGKKDSGSLSPKQHREPSPQVLEKSKPLSVLCNAPDSVVGQFVESNTIKNNPDGNQLKSNLDESIDKGFSPCSHGLLHNVKLETSEPPKSQELKTTSVSDHDNTCTGSSTQVDKTSQLETLFSNKFESTVPLRVIDPPIRDSPQSPDPEPQFVNPSSIGIDSVKTEEIRLPEMHTSVSMPHVKVENNFLPICGQATMSNMWPTVGGPISNVRNMDFRTLNLQSSGVSDTGMIEEDKLIEGGSPGLKHQKILGHGGGHSDPATDPDIQGSGPKIDPVTKRPGPGISDPGMRNAGSHMKELVHRGPQIDLIETGIRFPGPDMRGPGMQGISPNICPGSDTQDLAISGQGKHVRDPGTGMQGSEANIREPVIQQHNSDRIGSSPVIGGSGMRSPVQNMQGPDPDMRHSELEVRGRMLVTAAANSHMGGSGLQNQRGDPIMKGPPSYRPGPDVRGTRGPLSAMYHPSPENADGRPGVMEIRRDQSFGGPQIEGRAADIIGRGQKDRGESPHTGGMRSSMRGGDVRDPSPGPSFRGSGRVQMQLKHDGSPVSSSGPREHFNEPLPNIRAERMVHGPDMTEGETIHNLRRPDLTERSYMGPGQDMDSMGGSDTRGDGMLNITNPDWRGPGPGFVGPDMRGQRSQNKGLCPHLRGPDWRGIGSEIRDVWRGSDMKGSGPVRGEPFIQDKWRVHQPDKRDPNIESQGHDTRGAADLDFREPGSEMSGPNMEDLRHDRRRPGGPDFITPGPVMRGPDMEIPMHDRRGPRGPDLMRPEPEWSSPTMGNLGPGMQGPVGPDFAGQGLERRGLGPNSRGPGDPHFRGPGPERKGPAMEGQGPDMRGPAGPDFKVPWPERRGPGGPDFRGPGPEWRVPAMEGPATDMQGLGGPDFSEPGPERRGLSMEGPRHVRRGPGGPDFRGPVPERRGPGMEGPGPDSRGPGGPHFSEPASKRRSLSMESPGPARRGPGDPGFSEPGPESRGLSMEGPGPAKRGSGGPDFRGRGPERRGPVMEGPGPVRRGPGSPDFGPPGPERRCPVIEGPGPDRRRARGPDFRGPGPERRDPVIEGPGPDRRNPGDPDFRGLGPERRGQSMEGPGPEWRGPAIEGSGPDRRGPGGPDFRGPGPEGRSLSLKRHGPDSRRSGSPDFRGVGSERRGPAMEAPGLDRRGPGSPDFSGPGPQRRGSAMGGSGPDRREIDVLDFQGPGSERGGHTMNSQEPDSRAPDGPDFRGPGCERRDSYMKGQRPDRRGPGDQNTYLMGPGPDFTVLGPERTGSGIEGPGPHSREQGRPHFRGPGPKSGQTNMEGPGPDTGGRDIRGPRPERPGSSMQGPGPNRRMPGGPDIRRPGLQHSGPNRESPGPDRRTPEMERTGNSRSFPGGPLFRGPETERRPPDREGPESDRRGPHFREVRPEITVMEGPGPDRKHPRGPDFRGPGCLSRGPDIEGPWSGRQEPGSSGFRELGPERRGPDMEGPEPDWRRSGGPDFRGPGIRQKAPNTGGLRHRRDDWEGADFGGSEPIQESPVIEGQGPDRTGRNLRGPRPTRGNIRGSGPNFRGSAPDRRGTDTEEQWSEGTGPNMEALGNERDCSGDDWKIHGNRGPGPIQEGPGQQVQEHSRQGPRREWRGPESRGPRPIQERPTMPFPGPLRAPGDDWSGPGVRGPGPVQGDPDMVCPGPGRGRPGNGWNEPDRGDAGPNRRGPGPNFCGERDPDNRGQGRDRRGLGMREPVSDMRGGPDMGNDWRQPDFKGNMRGANMEGPWARSGGPDSMNFPNNRRGFEMEGLDRRVPRGPDFRHQGPENRNSNIEGPGTDGRFSNCGGLGSERQDVDMESPGIGRQGFEHDFRRKSRGPDIRRLGPCKTDIRGPAPESSDLRHGPGRWDTNTEGPGSDRRGPDMMGRGLDSRGYEPAMKDDMEDIRGPGCDGRGLDITASPHFNITHQVTRCQGPSDPNSASCNGPLGPAQNSGENSCPGFDNLQNQQAVKPHRHRAALLPTPTEGLIRFPNRMINNPDVLSLKRKQIGHPTNREWSRGKPVSRERELVKGQRQEQEKSPAGKISTPLDASTVGGEGKKEVGNETDKQGACVETKTKQIMDSDENKSNPRPS